MIYQKSGFNCFEVIIKEKGISESSPIKEDYGNILY